MISYITRGYDATGLTTYLVGEGRANEHTHPHLVAGSSPIMAWFDDLELTHENAVEIGRELEQPHRVYGTEVPAGHVWHCSLSLHRDDGILSDDQWSVIAEEFVRDMGFIDVEGKSDARWVAVRHGVSGQKGNDHVHVVVSLVRDDGTKADTWRDYSKARTVTRELEKRNGLLQIIPGRSVVGLTPGMVNGSQARGRLEPEPVTMARRVRAHAEASVTEAEFVRRCRTGGLLIKPTYAKGSQEEVSGYKVALKPPKGERSIYCGGMKLGRDLGLGTLRENWTDTPHDRAEAAEEWHAAKFGKRMVGPSPIGPAPDDLAWTDAAKELTKWGERMRAVPLDDHAQWRKMAAHVAGIWSSWSVAVEAEPGQFAAVADEIAKSAQMSRDEYRRGPRTQPLKLRAAVVLTYAATHGGPSAQWAVFTALAGATRAVFDYNRHRNDAVRERSFKEMMHRDLVQITKSLRSSMEDERGVAKAIGVGRGLPVSRTQRPVVSTPLERSQMKQDQAPHMGLGN
jgi:hypothetical protein